MADPTTMAEAFDPPAAFDGLEHLLYYYCNDDPSLAAAITRERVVDYSSEDPDVVEARQREKAQEMGKFIKRRWEELDDDLRHETEGEDESDDGSELYEPPGMSDEDFEEEEDDAYFGKREAKRARLA